MDVLDTLHAVLGHHDAAITWWQMIARGVVAFVFIIALIQINRRAFGRSAPIDVAVAVLVGSALSRMVTGNAPVAPVLAATGLLLVLQMLLAEVGLRFPLFRKVLEHDPILLVRDGEILWEGMERARVTRLDVEASLRKKGYDDITGVRRAYLEADASISIIR